MVTRDRADSPDSAWAARFAERSWAVENAGLGYLLAQQLVGAGEREVDVQAKLAARVRLSDNKSVNKNDPHDARSVAIAALRSPAPVEVRVEDPLGGGQAVVQTPAERHLAGRSTMIWPPHIEAGRLARTSGREQLHVFGATLGRAARQRRKELQREEPHFARRRHRATVAGTGRPD
jgi:hypothetical protein